MTDATKPAATMIPLLDLHAQYAPLRDKILAAVTRVCDSQRYIMGRRSPRSKVRLRPSSVSRTP